MRKLDETQLEKLWHSGRIKTHSLKAIYIELAKNLDKVGAGVFVPNKQIKQVSKNSKNFVGALWQGINGAHRVSCLAGYPAFFVAFKRISRGVVIKRIK